MNRSEQLNSLSFDKSFHTKKPNKLIEKLIDSPTSKIFFR